MVAFVAAACLMPGSARAVEPAELPTPSAIQKTIEGGKYHDALKDVTRLLAITGPSAAAYDRYDLQMFRAECQLQLHQQAQAIEALTAAQKEAFAQDKPERAFAPVALAYLVQHSSVYRYIPKAAGNHEPIPWLDRSRRAEAYRALLMDELPVVEKQSQGLAHVTAFPPLLQFAKTVGAMHALEQMCAAANEQPGEATKPLVTAVGNKAAQLIGAAMAEPSVKVTNISDTANQLAQVNIPQHDPNTGRSWVIQQTQRRGLTGEDTQYLKGAGTLCEKLVAAAKDISQALIADLDSLKTASTNAATLKLRVVDVLTDDYTQTTDRSQKNLTTQPQ
ncbi:MAG TPA: hypothetical protein VM008_01335 [Phycisphaerae bacterium]|nr:hypothetical protein [Phycisphaerae bacterium]